MEDSPAVSRRALLTGSGAVALTGSLALSTSFAESAAAAPPNTPNTAPASPLSKGRTRMRPTYHFSVPDNWKNDPQRPDLHRRRIPLLLPVQRRLPSRAAEAPHGAARRPPTTSRSATAASPSRSSATRTATAGQDALSSTSANTAGYGEGAVIALVTQAPQGKPGPVPLVLDGSRTIIPPW